MKAKIKISAVVATATIFLTAISAFAREFLPIASIHEGGSIANATFFNAGAALPATPSSMSLNPALPAAWHFFTHNRMSAFGIYHRERNDDFFNAGGGGSLALGMGQYFGVEYNLRRINDDNGDIVNRATFAYGMLIDQTDDDALFWGVNVSYFNSRKTVLRPALQETDEYREVFVRDNIFAADLGFYQAGSGEGLSWAIVLENIFGYWHNDFGGDISSGVLSKRYNSFLLGTCLSAPITHNVLLLVPLDVRFWGFMNKPLRRSTNLRYRTEVHSGLELQIGGMLAGRLGWAWIPEQYTTDEHGQLNFSGWDNRFNGGFGVNWHIFGVDMLFARNTWGIGVSMFL
ncbi:MAG: hypothetical protein FWE23_02255 [Chitinivibrionia bacterium]|nr:hypothetical protein [Chitinivibrionia bacterium]